MQHVFTFATLIIIQVTLHHKCFFSKLIKYKSHREIFKIRVVELNNYTFISRISSQKTSHLLENRIKIYSVLCLQHRICCEGKNSIKFSTSII